MMKLLFALFGLAAFVILLGAVWHEIDKMRNMDLDKDL